MSVVQISKIQIRRGKTQTAAGLPQLASGELAWSIDTAELFIGNGSVAEGAPQVGNTKILTVNDLLSRGNLLSVTNHAYRTLDTTTTHSIQDVLDYTVHADAFGAIHNGVQDDTEALQSAIDILFSTAGAKAFQTTPESVNSRVILKLLPGIYKISSTIFVPSYASIVGSGANNTIINYVGSGPVFQCINESDTPTVLTSTTSSNRPKHILISDLNITFGITASAFALNAVKSSTFENLSINGGWVSTTSPANVAFTLNAFSLLVTCEQNTFRNITIDKCYYGVYSKKDIIHNVFENIAVSNVYMGVAFGLTTNLLSQGEQYGPQSTTMCNCTFSNVKKQAILIKNGTANLLSNIVLENVGNDSDIETPMYPQIFLDSIGNKVSNIVSDRHGKLSHPQVLAFTKYVPEVAGHGQYTSSSSESILLTQMSNYVPLIILPVSTDQYGTPTGTMTFTIDYIYHSEISSPFSRKGVLTISSSVESAAAHLSDEYIFIGTGDDATQL